jgi:hypothetical protein
VPSAMSAPKLTASEVASMDIMHKKGKTPQQISAKLTQGRKRKGLDGPGSSAVYNFLAGATHQRGASENRGRPSKMPARVLARKLARKRES